MSRRLLSNEWKIKLAPPAVYGFWVHFCSNLREDSAKDIEKTWGMSSDEAYGLGLRSCPTLPGNLVSSQACFERFGSEILKNVPGFFPSTREGDVCWKLDIDPYLSRRGIILPVRNHRGIVNLKVFPHVNAHPFTLTVRREIAA